MTGRRSLRLAVIGVACSLAFVAAACSNDPDTESSEPGEEGSDQFADLDVIEAPDPCESDPGVTDDTITVGGLMPKSGESANSFSRAEDGIRARFELANEMNELGDRQIELDVADDVGNTASNLTAAERLVEQDNVFGIIEVSSAADGSAQYLFDNDIPVVGWHVGQPIWGEYPNMFSFNGINPESQQSTRNALVLKRLGATNVAVIGGGNPSSVRFVEGIAETIEADPDLEVVYQTVDVPLGSTEFTGEVQQIIDADADALYTGMDFLSNAALSEQLKQAGADDIITIFPGGYDPLALEAGGAGFDGAFFGLEFVPFEIDTAGYAAFEEAMADRPVGQVPMTGWLSADIFIQGLKAAGVECPTREAFVNNLRLEDDYTADGLLLPIDFSEQFGKQFQCVFYVQVQNGEFVPQFDGEPVCGEPFEG
ncbi:MAG: ABC transporter substrate-binding protein [Acidimicrobiia bacterium]